MHPLHFDCELSYLSTHPAQIFTPRSSIPALAEAAPEQTGRDWGILAGS